MGVREDSRALKNDPGPQRLWLGGDYHINDHHFSQTTRNILSSLFEPYIRHLKEKFYRLNDEQIKIVTDILDMMED